jgi:hypothetical protein
MKVYCKVWNEGEGDRIESIHSTHKNARVLRNSQLLYYYKQDLAHYGREKAFEQLKNLLEHTSVKMMNVDPKNVYLDQEP